MNLRLQLLSPLPLLCLWLLPACPGDPVVIDDDDDTSSPTTNSAGTTTAPSESTTAGESSTAAGSATGGMTTTGPSADGSSSGSTSPLGTESSTGSSSSTAGTRGSTDDDTSTGDEGMTTSGSSSGGGDCPAVLPNAPTGLILWLRGDVVALDPMGVLTWPDQSPMGNDATRSLASPAAPQQLLGGFMGQDAIGFGANAYITLDNTLNLGDFTIFVAGVNLKVNNDFHMIMGPGPLNQQMRYDSSNELLFVGPGNGGPVSTYTPGDTTMEHYFTIDGQGANWSLYWNGSFDSTAVTAAGLWQLGTIGAWFGQHLLEGNLAEIIIYDNSLSDMDRDGIHCYLSARYMLP